MRTRATWSEEQEKDDNLEDRVVGNRMEETKREASEAATSED